VARAPILRGRLAESLAFATVLRKTVVAGALCGLVALVATARPGQVRSAPVADGGCAQAFRGRVQTLSDAAAAEVRLSPLPASVRGLVRLRRPARLQSRTPRLRGVERRVYRIRARLVSAMLFEGGSGRLRGIELVVADPRTRQSIIVAFPAATCGHSRAPARRQSISSALASFVSACGEPPTTHFARLRGVATIVGVGFFSSKSTRRDAARNGLELSPVLGFRSTSCKWVAERPAFVAAAGDVACDPDDPAFNGGQGTPRACRMLATSDLLTRPPLDAVLALGDLQYSDGAYSRFIRSYDLSWGRVKGITHPVVGNHEYLTPGATGYFQYFGTGAGPAARGYYSFDLRAWHVIALNANCEQLKGHCSRSSPQQRWLEADLADHPNRCVLAYWHQPLFSSGQIGGHESMGTQFFWRALYDAGADLVLNGHDHDYERFAPQTPGGRLDLARGIRQFVVGTGGKSLLPFGIPAANSETWQNTVYGVLKLTLHPAGYQWKFAPEAGKTFADVGSATCH